MGKQGRLSHPFAGEHLHRVALEDVVPAVERNTALEALAHLVDVVLEALEGANATLPQLLTAASDPHTIAAVDDSVGDDAAGDHMASCLERLAHLGMAVHHFL